MEIVKKEQYLIKELKKITWPLFVETLLFSLLGGIDTLMLGRYSDNAVAAVGIANQLIWLVNIMFGVITAGTSILLAQYIGAKSDEKNIIELCGISVGVNGILGLIISAVMVFGGSTLLRLLKSAPELIELGTEYMQIVGGFLFIQAILMTFTAILRSNSLTKICMNVTLIMNISNVILNYIFIFGNFGAPELGVKGAAIATTLSRILGMVILARSVWKLIFRKLKLSHFRPFPKIHLNNIFKIGIPTAAEQVSYNLSQLMVTSFINMISIDSMAAKSYVNTIASFAFVFAVAVGQGGSILIGQLIGDKDEKNAYKLFLYCLKRAIIIAIIVSVSIAVFGRTIFGFMTENKDIISIGATILIIDVFLEVGRTLNIVGINALRATGDVRFPVYIGIFSMWTFGVGAAYILGIKMGLGLAGIWIGFTIDEWFRGILVFFRWRRGKWKGKSFA
ncbi:MAG: MATE family efflux transporter [Clostridium sp.]